MELPFLPCASMWALLPHSGAVGGWEGVLSPRPGPPPPGSSLLLLLLLLYSSGPPRNSTHSSNSEV